MSKKFHTVTDIVAAIYCEQKVVFDHEHGKATPLIVRAKAAAGTFEHLRFQVEGHTRAAVDRRCFIATAIYGSDAPETAFLRAWRDRVLVPSVFGRAFIGCYYRLSPRLVPTLERSARAAAFVRTALNRLLGWLGMQR